MRLFQGILLDHLQESKGPTGHIISQANVSPEVLVDTMGLSRRVPSYCLCVTLLSFFQALVAITALKAMLEEHKKIVNLPDYQHLVPLSPKNLPGKEKGKTALFTELNAAKGSLRLYPYSITHLTCVPDLEFTDTQLILAVQSIGQPWHQWYLTV